MYNGITPASNLWFHSPWKGMNRTGIGMKFYRKGFMLNIELYLYFIKKKRIMNIYVGNLDYKVTEDDLENLFSKYGSVSSSSIITDKYSGRSKGFGFVTMDNDEEAKQAISELNETKPESRDIVVNEAKPRKSNY